MSTPPSGEVLRDAGRVVVVAGDGTHSVSWSELLPDGTEISRESLTRDEWLRRARTVGTARVVWNDTRAWYPALLAEGIRVERCHDLRLAHAILRSSELVAEPGELRAATAWTRSGNPAPTAPRAPTLFDDAVGVAGVPEDPAEVLAEYRRQREAIASSSASARLRLLVAAESAGALIAVELHDTGLPWDAEEHRRILVEMLGERPVGGGVPALLAAAADRVREAVGDPELHVDSPPRVLRALHRVGVQAESTSRWELARFDHPAVPALLEYKRLSRLATANGWEWLDEWVRDGRFAPVYVPAGVVTGRWASSGGGALQIPRLLRRAVRADPGWTLVVADVAQLEPRVLAAMASDHAMADAARGRDLYEGIVALGAVPSRADAKLALLGAMYGATSGQSGRLVPALRRAFPRAMALVDDAARRGEEGGVVSTWLGRTSPPPDDAWRAVQALASGVEATDADESRARRAARDRGRFTRNFVVQGTAAEWALCWLADLRRRLAELPVEPGAPRGASERAHLAFFLHDEIIVHTPSHHANVVADAVRDSAASATKLLFGDFSLDFPLDLRVAENASKA